MNPKKLSGKGGDVDDGLDVDTTEEKVDELEAATKPILPVATLDDSEVSTAVVSTIPSRVARGVDSTTMRVASVTGVLLSGDANDLIEGLLGRMNVDLLAVDKLLANLRLWGGPDLDFTTVVREHPDVVKKMQILSAMQAYIPGSALLIEHFFENEFEVLANRKERLGVALKVDLSGFTSTLKSMEADEGDASGLSPLINSDLDMIAEFCTAAGFKLVSLGGDAATFVYFGEDAYIKADPLRRAIADLSRCHASTLPGGSSGRFLHHDFKVVAVYGPIEMFPVQIEDRMIFRVGGDAVSGIDNYEKKLEPGGSTMEIVTGYSVPEPLLTSGQAVLSGAHDRMATFPALSLDSVSLEELSQHLDDLIVELSKYLRPDISLLQVVEGDFRDTLREHSTVIISMKGLRDSGASEEDFISEVSRQAKLHGGVVYKVEGDVIIALFPKHIAGDSYAKRAYEFSNNCMDLNSVCRYAMTSGKLLESLLGPQGNQELGVLGIAVNRAARILSVNNPGEIGVDDASYQKLARLVEDVLEDYEERGFKGLDVTRVLKVKGVKDESSQPITRLLEDGSWVEIVGRSEEIERFKSFFDSHSKGEKSGVVYVKAESGMGKNLFLANALAKVGPTLDEPLVEHESDLFKRPYSACFGLTRSIVDKIGGLVNLGNFKLSDGAKSVISMLAQNDYSQIPSDEVLARALIDLLKAWASDMKRGSEPGYVPKLTLVLGKISFWDPQSLKIMSLVYDYFMSTSEMRILFIFTHNTSVGDTRSEERKAFLNKIESDASSSGLPINLSALTKEATRDLVLGIAKIWEEKATRVHPKIVDFIYRHSGGNPARVKTLASIIFDPLNNPKGKSKFAIIEELERSGSLTTNEGLSLSYIDYLGFENPGQVKQFVQVFALLGNAFPLNVLEELASDYVAGGLEEGLEYVVGVLSSRGILKIDGEMVSFKHSGQRADFRGSIARADKKAYLMKAVDDFSQFDSTSLMKISKFHWLKELVELWNGDGDVQKNNYVARMVAWGASIADQLSRKPGNQMSIIYYADEVVKKLIAVSTTPHDITDFESRFSSLEDALSGVYADKPTVIANYCELALSAASAYLGTGNLDSSLIAERMLVTVEKLSKDPAMTVKSIVGQIRAQVWRGRHDEENRNRLIKATSQRLVDVRSGFDGAVELDEELDKESNIVSAVMLCVIDCIHSNAVAVSDLQVAIQTMEALLIKELEYLSQNTPLYAWMMYLLARLYLKVGAAKDVKLKVRRECFGKAMEHLNEVVPEIEKYKDKVGLVKLFPNVIDVYLLGRMAASYFQATFKTSEDKDNFKDEIDDAAKFEAEMSESGCRMAEGLGVQKGYIQALESKILFGLGRGELAKVADAATEMITVAEMISDRASLANSQYIMLLLNLDAMSGVAFTSMFAGKTHPDNCVSAYGGIESADLRSKMQAALRSFVENYKDHVADRHVSGHLNWMENLLAT